MSRASKLFVVTSPSTPSTLTLTLVHVPHVTRHVRGFIIIASSGLFTAGTSVSANGSSAGSNALVMACDCSQHTLYTPGTTAVLPGLANSINATVVSGPSYAIGHSNNDTKSSVTVGAHHLPPRIPSLSKTDRRAAYRRNLYQKRCHLSQFIKRDVVYHRSAAGVAPAPGQWHLPGPPLLHRDGQE